MVGGAEHAAMHLLYARFITKVLHDMGLIDFDEPFLRLVHQGTILGPDGNKMSKSKGNTINPDDYIERYGSDVFRMYLAFGFSFVDGGPWNDDGIKGDLEVWSAGPNPSSMRSCGSRAGRMLMGTGRRSSILSGTTP